MSSGRLLPPEGTHRESPAAHGTHTADAWGLVSDVHGNLAALEVAIRTLRDAGATRLAFLGDYLGKGDADGCVELIREVADVAIVGNRDLDWQDRVSSTSKQWVLSLPRTARVGRLLMSHGDARLTPSLSTSQIGRDFARVWREMELDDAHVWAFGHSHRARVWRKAQLDAAAELLASEVVEMDASGGRYFVNVGTTGLPFPGKGGPAVALVDFARRQIRQLPLAPD